ERTPSQVPRPSHPVRKATHTGNTFASVVNGNLVSPMSSSPALVLDDTCLEDRDYENCIVWINIEGVPLHAWSRAMFAKIGSKWGEMIYLEDGSDDLFAHKRICIKTSHASNILETFKIIVKRKVFWVSSDPFNIYGLLNNRKKDNGTAGSNTTPPFPSGFTPKVRQQGHYDNGNPNVDNVIDTNASPCKSVGSNTRIAKEAGNVDGNLYTDNRSCRFKLKEGGSILDILDEMIKVGQTIGFSMVGCTKDMEGIIGAQGENVSLLVKRLLWNYLSSLITRWNGECLVMGDFNEVRRMEERPILLREVIVDYGATPFRFYHSW
nr:RNA-directed DNA polymerase, eukaryota [Tanacetum cinerariifolium]